MVKYYSLIKHGRVKFRYLANGNSKQNHEIIGKINFKQTLQLEFRATYVQVSIP